MFKRNRNDIERIDCDIHSMAKEINENRDAIKRLAVLLDKQTLRIGALIQPIHQDLMVMQNNIQDINQKIKHNLRSNESLRVAYQSTSTMRKDFDGMIQEVEKVKLLLKKLNKDLGNA
jgi:predicted RNase H-like nuclease (RuvC/YqgF family)